MVSERWPMAGLVALSLLLAAGWAWFSRREPPRLAGKTARLLYFVGFPYAGLLAGLFTPRLLGLKGLEHFGLVSLAGSAWPGAAVQRATTLMLVEWLVDSSLALALGLAGLLLWLLLLHSLARRGVTLAVPGPVSLDGAVYDSLHWAFYRAAAWSLTGDLYLGVVWGAGLVLLEGALVARLSAGGLLQPAHLLRAMLLMITSVIFFYNPNLWLLMPLHWLMVIAVKNVTRNLQSSPAIR